MSRKKNKFKLIRDCQKLCVEFTKIQNTSNKAYRYTICQDIRRKCEQLIHLISRANKETAGTKHRIELQEKSYECIDDIHDLLFVISKLVNLSENHEGEIDIQIENIKKELNSWQQYDLNIAKTINAKIIRKLAWRLFNCNRIYNSIKKYSKVHNTKDIIESLYESDARYRIAYDNYINAIKEYDELIEKLNKSQALAYKEDESTLNKVIKQIEEDTNTKIIYFPNELDDTIVRKQQQFIKEVNTDILKKDYIRNDSTRNKLNARF